MRGADAHIPDRGMAETLYQEVLKTFMKQIPTAVFNHLHKPSGKTLWDRFKRLVSHRRASVKRTAAASGIIERHGEKEQLLDDLIMEVDEKEEAARAEKNEQNLHEKRLVAAGESIRGMALKRKSSPNEEHGSDQVGEEAESAPSSAKKFKRLRNSELSHSDDKLSTGILAHVHGREEIERKKMVLEEQRVYLERQRQEKESQRFEAMQAATCRRLELDEMRFELEKEERKQLIEERKQGMAEREQMVAILELLATKLQ